MGDHLILSHQTSDHRREQWSIFTQPLQRAAHTGAVDRMLKKKEEKKKQFVNSCCLADPRLIFPQRSRIIYHKVLNLCVSH